MFLGDRKKLAKALEVAPEIIPYLARLLADIQVLGSWPDEIVELLRSLELPPHSTKVLDLGCGKGAVSLSVARDLGFRVRGVDIFQPFIEEASNSASALDLASLCQFEVNDIRDVLQEDRAYNIVIFASVGGVLGDFAGSVPLVVEIKKAYPLGIQLTACDRAKTKEGHAYEERMYTICKKNGRAYGLRFADGCLA